MKTTFKQYLSEAKAKAFTIEELVRTMENGAFTLDGSDIKVAVCRLNGYEIKSLIGAPSVAREFDCSDNQLTSLEGCPKIIAWDFSCFDNQLTHLIDGPQSVKDFNCANNRLISLEGAPQIITGEFNCRNNMLKSLEGLPQTVVGDLNCTENLISTVDGMPSTVYGDIFFSENRLTTLKGIHLNLKEVGYAIDFEDNPIQSHVLGLLKIKGLQRVDLDNKKVQVIINKYLPEGDIFACQQELIDGDFEEFAQL